MYAVIDTNTMKVVDVVSSDVRALFVELTELYKRLTGSKDVNFSSFEEARQKVVEAVQIRYLASTGTKLPEPPPPEKIERAPADVNTLGPVALARMVFEEMKGARRKDIIEACARLGIKRSTASTQYQKWMSAHKTANPTQPEKPGDLPRLPPGVMVGTSH